MIKMTTRKPIPLLLFILSAILSSCFSTNTDLSSSKYTNYTDKDWGISFDYPSTMIPNVKTDSREESGVALSSIIIQLTDRRETTIILFKIVDDPVLASYPDWYPPSNIQLKIYAAQDLGELTLEKTEENSKAIRGALETGTIGKIGDFTSIDYRAFLNDYQYGYVYIRGAVIITPKRSYTIMDIGGLSKEGSIHKTVKPERVDEIWNRLLSSILIEE